MVQIGLTADFKRKVLQWDEDTVHIKDPRNFLRQSDLTKRKMRKVVMQNAEPDSTREATERMVKILNGNYSTADLKQVVNKCTR